MERRVGAGAAPGSLDNRTLLDTSLDTTAALHSSSPTRPPREWLTMWSVALGGRSAARSRAF